MKVGKFYVKVHALRMRGPEVKLQGCESRSNPLASKTSFGTPAGDKESDVRTLSSRKHFVAKVKVANSDTLLCLLIGSS